MLHPELHLLGNHLLENGLGLVSAAAVSEGPEADVWWAVGRRLLSWQLDEQFLADGGHFERLASYHVALTHALLETMHLADAGGRGAPSAWRRVAERALRWCVAVRAPDGTVPMFNDAALDACPPVDDVIALGRALGCGALRAPDADDVVRTEVLRDTGWVTARTRELFFAMDVGPDGASYQPGHVHADALTFELWLDGERVVTDYGVASYAVGPARDATRATRSHNTVTLDDVDSCEVWGRLSRRPARERSTGLAR